jgi:hypothetical protein
MMVVNETEWLLATAQKYNYSCTQTIAVAPQSSVEHEN